MSSNSKWPDFHLASKLWSLVGSQSSGPAKPATSDGASSAIGNHEDQRDDREPLTSNDRLPQHNGSEKPTYLMTDPDGRPIDGLGGFETFGQDAEMDNAGDDVGNGDDDFGTLEMFDSNATQAPYSSQMNTTAFERNGRAPEAVMFEEAPAALSKKSKRSKKKKGSSHLGSGSSLAPVEEELPRKQRKSKRKSALPNEIADSFPVDQASALDDSQLPTRAFGAIALANDDTAAPSTHSKRKRKSSGSAEGKQRKKRKSQDYSMDTESQDVVHSTQDHETSPTSAQPISRNSQAAAFLRTGESSVAQASLPYEQGTPDSEHEKSPSAARLQRRSRSREARSRENSVAHDTAQEMDIDSYPGSAQDDRDLGTDSYALTTNGTGVTEGMNADADVENLAREAWNEHVNGHSQVENNVVEEREDVAEMPDSTQLPQNDTGLYDVPQSPVHDEVPPSTTSKKTRSARKKAKPTYFEKPSSPDASHEVALNELPSPSAMTPKPRKRTKKATKPKKLKTEPNLISSSMPGPVETEAEYEGATQDRKSRMKGYTQGRFSEEELSRIARAIESFRVENHMEQYQVNEMLHAPGGTTAGESHSDLWARIFITCPDRHRQKIINISRKKFHNYVARGTWTHEQDTELRDLIEVHGMKWSKIAAIINRHPEDVRDRYRNYIVCGDSQRKDNWDEDEEHRLSQYIMESMAVIDEMRGAQPDREFLMKPYEELIDWQSISERMERTRSRLQCITKWKAMNLKTHGKDKLVSDEPGASISFRLEKARRQIAAMPEEERYRLVLAVQASAAPSESKVPWSKMLDKKFRNKWHRPTQMLLWRRLKQNVPGWETKTVRDCAQYLVDQYNQSGQLPEVQDEDYNDAQEMEYMSIIPVSSAANARPSHGISTEMVGNSDVEDEAHEENGHKGEEEIDIAAAAAAVPEENIQPDLPVEPMAPMATKAAKKSTPGKKKTIRKPTAASKRAAAKKAAALSQDPIVDDEDAVVPPDAIQEEASEIDEAQLRSKKKTPSKFRSSANGAMASPRSELSSAMDDMEDLPARIPV
ncbi:hypothetical protein G7046_g1730 [Stylonectria norvegica]|nr:hypothetical protein G7046_g1730 [Stylonectria norvegica]